MGNNWLEQGTVECWKSDAKNEELLPGYETGPRVCASGQRLVVCDQAGHWHTGLPTDFVWRNAQETWWTMLQVCWTQDYKYVIKKNKNMITQRDITPYRAYAHKRYTSTNRVPEHVSDFFRATQYEM